MMRIAKWPGDREAVRFGHLEVAPQFRPAGMRQQARLFTKHAIRQKSDAADLGNDPLSLVRRQAWTGELSKVEILLAELVWSQLAKLLKTDPFVQMAKPHSFAVIGPGSCAGRVGGAGGGAGGTAEGAGDAGAAGAGRSRARVSGWTRMRAASGTGATTG